MSLRAPAFVSLDVLPLRVVIGGRGPAHIIAQVKLPLAINRHRSPADILNGQRGRTIGLRSYGWLCSSNNRRGHRQQQREQTTHAAHRRSLATSVQPWALASVRSQALAQLPATVASLCLLQHIHTHFFAPKPRCRNQRFVISTEAAHGPIVSGGVKKSA